MLGENLMTRSEAFEILALDLEASLDEARRAYRRLAKHYHPDRNSAPNAAVMFRIIQDAWQFIQNDTERKTAKKESKKHDQWTDTPFERAIGWETFHNHGEREQYWNPKSNWGDRFFYFKKSEHPTFQLGQKVRINTGEVRIKEIVEFPNAHIASPNRVRLRTSDNQYFKLEDIEKQIIRSTEWVTTTLATYRCPQHGKLHKKVFYTINPLDKEKEIWYGPSCVGKPEKFTKAQLYLFGADHHFYHLRNILGKIEHYSKSLSLNWFSGFWETYTLRLSIQWHEREWLNARRGADDWNPYPCDEAFSYWEVQMVEAKVMYCHRKLGPLPKPRL